MITNRNIEELRNNLLTYYAWYNSEALISDKERETANKEFTECNRIINELWDAYQAYGDSTGERRWHDPY